MKYIVTINNKNYEVEVEKGQASIISTEESAVREPVTQVSVKPETAPTQAPAPVVASSDAAQGTPVNAPMPGTILSIKVNSGQKVRKGEILFILEAMKMENEITASVDGTIAQIMAAKGSPVATGDLLAVIQ